MRLILYSKPGCHLCEGLQEKLEQVENLSFELEVRDITTREDWFLAYQYEVPVICLSNHPGAEDAEGEGIEERLPRPSPRASLQQLTQMLSKYFSN
ncbi:MULTISPECIES: glutaredoxin family protein [Cyanophyceae]|uniref:glutaredoxin family protein n=1 Tax=Cyanophyceae TaxID=3028117 RepID=UPI0023304EEF|nr:MULTISPECIES: glutaredoxin family protein [Cyanophyceae]MDB9357102.1 glutaredoxin family protein [Nodularia spumigena CS-587/03]MDB9319892.1 glutaredoxin family protein [Nodularia spumigena CS-590/01A]MDB9327507.1 glutaredoxin family protein [Nodularia spumigena CS-590/02]MDB9334597.1 glutaredoxin family protein [Nodularia spumigena CS-590/01]MDB9338210.1 glutaredoxin family protein [Nodularia spumigena CS-589/07]